MGWLSPWVVVVVALLLAVMLLGGGWLSWTAGRLDRMHLRLEAARASLEAHLQRRASVAGELAGGGLSDPASALLLLEAARAARESAGRSDEGAGRASAATPEGAADWSVAGDDERWMVESELTAALFALDLPSPSEEPLVAELTDAARKAGMARRIHNDVAARTGELHKRRRVRWFHLAGHAAPPRMIEFDDRADFAPPPAARATGSGG